MTTATPVKPGAIERRDKLRPALEIMLKVFPDTNTVARQRFSEVALTLMTKSAELGPCTEESKLLCLYNCAKLGLVPDGVSGHVYILPFWNSKLGKSEAKMIVGYQGFMELARRSGVVAGFRGGVVREGDYFEYDQGLGGYPKHIDARMQGRKRGDIIAAYAIAEPTNKDGKPTTRVVFPEDFDRAQSASKAKGGPWETDPEAMCLKTAFRRLSKWLPLSPMLARAVALEDKAEGGQRQMIGDEEILDVIDTTATVVPPEGRGKFGFSQPQEQGHPQGAVESDPADFPPSPPPAAAEKPRGKPGRPRGATTAPPDDQPPAPTAPPPGVELGDQSDEPDESARVAANYKRRAAEKWASVRSLQLPDAIKAVNAYVNLKHSAKSDADTMEQVLMEVEQGSLRWELYEPRKG